MTASLLVCGIAAVTLALIAAGRRETAQPDSATLAQENADLPDLDSIAGAPSGDLDLSTGRPVYRYSVIPGGAYNAHELAEAIDRDPVVAAAYRAVAATDVHSEVVPADRMAYMSYRVRDRIYWTKHQIRLRKGEVILTNGEAELRGRCGNGISLEPMLPIADSEPGPLELEALSAAESPLLPSRPLRGLGGFASGVGQQDQLRAGPSLGGPHGASSSPLGGLGIPDTGVFGASFPGGLPEVTSDPLPVVPPGIDTPIFGTIPGFGATPGSTDEDVVLRQIQKITTNANTSTTDDGGGPGNPGNPQNPGNPETPSNPVPTPEPGTLLLVGGAISITLGRLRSRRRKDSTQARG